MDPQDDGQNQNTGGTPVPPPTGGTPVPPPTGGAPVPPPTGGTPVPPLQPPAAPPMGMPPAMGQPPVAMPPAMGQPPMGMPPAMGQPPMGGMQPPAGGMPTPPPTGGAPVPPPEDNTPANFQLGTKLPAQLKVLVPPNELNFDGDYFIRLLAGSISLSKDEKKRIVDSIPKLKQAQIDELIRIFEEEKQKFAALSKKHVPQLEKLAQQHFDEWMDLESDIVQSSKSQEDAGKADEIRKNLGL